MSTGGCLTIIVMRVLSQAETTGYGLIKNIEKHTAFWKPSTGSIYPILKKLTKKGLIESKEKSGKKIYSLTKEGKRFLQKITKSKEQFMKKVIKEIKLFDAMTGENHSKAIIPFIEHIRDNHDALIHLNPELTEFRMALISLMKNPSKHKKVKKVLKETAEKLKKI